MNKYSAVAISCLMTVALGSCKEKKQSDIIITKKVEAPKAPTGTQEMSPSAWSNNVEWLGSSYTISINRYADRNLPEVKDESGRRYYDNKIDLKVSRQDGSTVVEKTFSKDTFREYLNSSWGKNGALLGLAFDRADNSNLYFGAGVGSPDAMSDEYVPLTVVVSKSGSIKIKADTQLDISNGSDDASKQSVDDDDDGV